MVELKAAATQFDRTLAAFTKALETYAHALVAAGVAAGDATARGLDGRQVRRRLKEHVIARLSPKPVLGMPDPILQLEGAPEARRFSAANPLPGLS